MKVPKLIAPTCLSALIYLSGCSGVGTDVLAGRNALQTGRPNDAVGYLKRAADLQPNYQTPYRVRVGVLSLLGRAYYESGRDDEALQALERAVSLDQDDPLAHLYLGLTLLRKGDNARGRKEVETGLKAIGDTLDYINMDRVYGLYWDPGMNIRGAVKHVLAAKLDNTQLATAAAQLGVEFDEEIDRARRDEGRRGGGSDGGGGN
jgi:tetratricopeptide (TPR) repeat protein